MKICDSCGHENWTVIYSKKNKAVCSSCQKPMSSVPQCNPMVGGTDLGRDETGNLSESTFIHLIPQSDER